MNNIIYRLTLAINNQKEVQNLIFNQSLIKSNIQIIFSPVDLLNKLREYESENLITFPITPTVHNIHKFYGFSSTDIKNEADNIVITLSIPLIKNEIFTLIRPTILPFKSEEEGIFKYIKTNFENFAINNENSYYFPITKEKLNLCFETYPANYLCEQTFQILSTLETDKCEINLLINKKMDKSCKTNLIKTQEILIELAKKDKYIVATYRNQSISMQCKNETSSIQISGTNLLIMPEGCSLSTHKYQIFKKNVVKHEILESKLTKIIDH